MSYSPLIILLDILVFGDYIFGTNFQINCTKKQDPLRDKSDHRDTANDLKRKEEEREIPKNKGEKRGELSSSMTK